jgi:uncharacterized membrane protein
LKRQLTNSQFLFLSQELDYCETKGLVQGDQKKSILEQYAVKPGLNFIKVVVTIGAILIGLGVLSFIASNWDGIGKIAKLAIICVAFVGSNLTGYMLSNSYPRTGRSLIYLGTLVYGAGIFLIGQMFNFGGDFTTAFLLWALGIVPLALQQKDKFIMLFANILFGVYITGSIDKEFPYVALLGVPALYFAVRYFDKSRLLLFFANLTALDLILHIFLRYEVDGLYVATSFFCIGLLMYAVKHSFHREIFRLQGNLVFGIAGVAITFPDLWEILISEHAAQVTASIVFAVIFVVMLFTLIRKGSLISLAFVCITIFRFYLDTFALLPKSLFFIVGGLLLLGFGYYFERMRKAGGMQV